MQYPTKAMFIRYQSKMSPVKNVHGTYCLYGTVSFFVRKYLLFTRDRLFEIVLRAYRVFSAIYHVDMRRSILYSVMAPKRKAANACDEENDSNDTEKCFTWTDEEVSFLLQIATAYKSEKQTKERIGNRSNHATKIFGNYFVSDNQNQRQSLNIFPMPKILLKFLLGTE